MERKGERDLLHPMQQSINIIRLDASLSSCLEWEEQAEVPDFWEFDFGWEKTPFSPFCEGAFAAYQLSVEEYGKKLSTGAKVILGTYRSTFKEFFQPSERLEIGYQEFLDHYRVKQAPHLFELYCTNLLSDYLHRLAALLPEDAIPYLHIDVADDHLAERVLLFCARRFAHFQFFFSNHLLPIIPSDGPIGVSLPADHLFKSEKYIPLLKALADKGLSFHCIPEEMLNDFWDGIDHLIIDPETMSETGERMLCGFEAAGGEIVTMGGDIGSFQTVSFEEYLKISE